MNKKRRKILVKKLIIILLNITLFILVIGSYQSNINKEAFVKSNKPVKVLVVNIICSSKSSTRCNLLYNNKYYSTESPGNI